MLEGGAEALSVDGWVDGREQRQGYEGAKPTGPPVGWFPMVTDLPEPPTQTPIFSGPRPTYPVKTACSRSDNCYLLVF